MVPMVQRAVARSLPWLLSTVPCLAAPALQGRWEGEVSIPSAPMAMVLDLDGQAGPDGATAWIGSVILPGHGIKGAALSELQVTGSDLRFTLSGVMVAPGVAPPHVTARLVDAGTLEGAFEQAGHSAPFTLVRTGVAQVDPAPRGTGVSPALEGSWSGSFELGGYPRKVTLTLHNQAGSMAAAELVVVGRKTTRVPVDLVTQQQSFLRIEAHEAGIAFEGQWQPEAGRIQGSFLMGPFDLPTVLSREPAQAGSGS
jgi:hypothetical protein